VITRVYAPEREEIIERGGGKANSWEKGASVDRRRNESKERGGQLISEKASEGGRRELSCARKSRERRWGKKIEGDIKGKGMTTK